MTGSNGGIGLETCKAFLGIPELVIRSLLQSLTLPLVLAQGAKVIAHYNRSKDNLDGLVSQNSGRVEAVQADLKSEKAVDSLFSNRKCQILVGTFGRRYLEDSERSRLMC